MWVQCHHCEYWFDLEKPNGDYGIIYEKGEIASHICPSCTAKVERMPKEKKEVKQCMNTPKDH